MSSGKYLVAGCLFLSSSAWVRASPVVGYTDTQPNNVLDNPALSQRLRRLLTRGMELSLREAVDIARSIAEDFKDLDRTNESLVRKAYSNISCDQNFCLACEFFQDRDTCEDVCEEKCDTKDIEPEHNRDKRISIAEICANVDLSILDNLPIIGPLLKGGGGGGLLGGLTGGAGGGAGGLLGGLTGSAGGGAGGLLGGLTGGAGGLLG